LFEELYQAYCNLIFFKRTRTFFKLGLTNNSSFTLTPKLGLLILKPVIASTYSQSKLKLYKASLYVCLPAPTPCTKANKNSLATSFFNPLKSSKSLFEWLLNACSANHFIN